MDAITRQTTFDVLAKGRNYQACPLPDQPLYIVSRRRRLEQLHKSTFLEGIHETSATFEQSPNVTCVGLLSVVTTLCRNAPEFPYFGFFDFPSIVWNVRRPLWWNKSSQDVCCWIIVDAKDWMSTRSPGSVWIVCIAVKVELLQPSGDDRFSLEIETQLLDTPSARICIRLPGDSPRRCPMMRSECHGFSLTYHHHSAEY
jgi:hypothetical protein